MFSVISLASTICLRIAQGFVDALDTPHCRRAQFAMYQESDGMAGGRRERK